MRMVFAALLLLMPVSAFGQLPQAGDTVRVTTERRFEAHWLRIEGDSARMLFNGSARALRLDEIKRIEIGEQRHAAMRGMMIGALSGAFLYTALGAQVYEAYDDTCDGVIGDCPEDESDYKLVNALIGGAGGAAAGLLVGSFLKTTRWREIDLPK